MKRRLLASILSLVMILSLLPVTAMANGEGDVTLYNTSEGEPQSELNGNCGANGDNVTWTLTGDEGAYTLTISGNGAMADYATGGAQPWVSQKANIKHVVIAGSVTSIGERAFMGFSALEDVVIPDSVTSYGTNAFHSCTSLSTLNIGKNVSSIGQIGIYLDTAMTVLTIDAQNDSYAVIDNWLYELNDDGTAYLWQVPAGVIKDAVTITVPDTIDWNGKSYTVVGVGKADADSYTLAGAASVTSVDLSSNVKEIGANAFHGAVELENIDISRVVAIGTAAFKDCTKLTAATFADGLTTIGGNAFAGTGLTEVKLPATLTYLGKYVFSGCEDLKTVIVKSDTLEICSAAFNADKKLEVLDLSAVKNLTLDIKDPLAINRQDAVLLICYVAGETQKTLLNNQFTDGTVAFAVTDGGTFPEGTVFTAGTLAEPTKLDSLFKGWFDKSGNEVTDENPAKAGNIYYAKWDDAQLSGNCGTVDSSGSFGSNAKWSLTPNGNGYTLTIYGSGKMADFSCNITNIKATQPWRESLSGVKNTDITKVVVIGVSNIGAFAFNGLSAVASYNIDPAVTTIGRWGIDTEGTETFELNGNTNFTQVDGVLMTADKATLIAYPGGADAVAEYVIPSTVTNVVGGAFVGCDAQKVVIPENVTDFSAWSFAGSSIEEIVFNANMQEIGAGMFAGLRELKTLDFGQYVTRIGTQSSYNLINLKNLVIPANVTSIGGQAFKYLGDEKGGTEKVTFEGNMPNMDDQVFLRQNRLTTVDLSKSTTFGTISWNFFGTESVAAYYFDTQEHAEMLTRKSINKTKAIFAVLNGGSIPADKGYYADCHDDAGSLVLVTPEKEGYTFEGWYDNADCTGTSVSDETVLQAGTVYYAKWVPNPYTVTFVANGGEASTNTMPVTYASAYGELPTATRTGFKFDGWFTAAEGGDKVESSTVCTTAANHTLYAHWLEKKTPELTISATPDTLRGGGKVELTVTASAGAGKITVTYKSASSEDVITLTPNADGKYTVTLPNRTETYTFTVDCAESAEFTHKTASCTVSVTRRTSSAANSGNTITVPSIPNGAVTVTPSTAIKDTTVTITTKPNEGYELGDLVVKDANGNTLPLTDKGDGKYTFTMPDSKVIVEASFVKAASTSFVDVPANAYFADAVKWAVDKGITNGLSDTMFGPYESCTRAQIVTFLWRAAGSPEPTSTSTFADVPASTYYAKAVAWAVENGITNGMTETTFAPNATCTRGQSVTFLYRALKGTASGSTNFTDVKSDAFYADAINWAVANNVTNGTSNTTFSPNADCTRAEIVTFLYRAYQGK